MRMYPREFPPGRRKDPKRRAECRVFEVLAGSPHRGFVYYEWRRGYQRIELDFALWIDGLGRFALQVKGGRYRLRDGEWLLAKRGGFQTIADSPLEEAWLAALDLHDDIRERGQTDYNPYVIPVLAFPDLTEPDPDIANLAARKGVYVIWGVENLLSDLDRIVRSRGVVDRLAMDRIAAEVLSITDGQIRLDAAAETGKGSAGLTLSVAGRRILQLAGPELHLRVETGADVSRKGGRQC